MRTAVRAPKVRPATEDGRASGRRARVVIRRLEPWSVLKFSLLFYFCLMMIFVVAMLLLYWVLGLTGVLDSLSQLMVTLAFGDEETGFQFNGFWIFSRLFLVGTVGVVLWSLVNWLVALLYNLVSDVVGGISVTLAERR
ncbi:MAG: DUF3566 domain-containing protein [Actinobacteria bacterium]|nr:DUF3566 domain-containing protein [Actinomycetota bacterium]